MFSKMTERESWLPVAAGIMIALCLASCDSFTVRDSEDPEGTSNPTDIVPAYEPGLVISNLVNSLKDKDAFEYNELFTEDFIFVADPNDVIDLENYYPGALSDWDVEVERRVAQRLLDQSQTANALLSLDEGMKEETVDTYVVQEDYRLRIVDQSGSLKSYIGTAIFYIRLEDDGLWYIHEWQDFRPKAGDADDRDTWGILKGEIRATM